MTAAAEAIQQYLQPDAPVRARLFDAFIEALTTATADGSETAVAARQWAARAVSPALDYSSLRRLKKHVKRPVSASALRIAVLGGPTTLQLVELMEIFLAAAGIDAALYQCEYGLFRQEMLTPGSGLDRFQPNVVFLAVSSRDVSRRPMLTDTADVVRATVDAEADDWARLWAIAAERWGATVIQNTFETPPWGELGHFAAQHAASNERYLDAIVDTFARRALPHVLLHDIRRLAADAGARAWFDPRFYLESKMPCGPECLVSYAHSATQLIAAIAGRSRKALVLDLDNTLWGGVVGDDGVGGIRVGQGSGEGEAFSAFQRYVKALRARGVVLAVCSKNDEARAREPFEARDDMALRLGDFACFVANWHDKAENLRRIAAELNLGLDALVFVDDNPAERALVRRLLPEVAVPDMPEDPAGYIEALGRGRYFEMASFTREDALRADQYTQNAQRNALASSAGDLDTFLASLNMVARVDAVGPLNIERVTQLINKSNQFNVTTRRYTVAAIEAMAADPSWITLAVSLRDTLGDHGLISVVLARQNANQLEIDTWLMSCRVLQRGVEALVRDTLVERARDVGCDVIVGTYVPTDRNAMVSDLFARLGWCADGDDHGTTRWRLAVATAGAVASHIRVEN